MTVKSIHTHSIAGPPRGSRRGEANSLAMLETNPRGPLEIPHRFEVFLSMLAVGAGQALAR